MVVRNSQSFFKDIFGKFVKVFSFWNFRTSKTYLQTVLCLHRTGGTARHQGKHCVVSISLSPPLSLLSLSRTPGSMSNTFRLFRFLVLRFSFEAGFFWEFTAV